MAESLDEYRKRAKEIMTNIEKMLEEFDTSALTYEPELNESDITGFELSVLYGDEDMEHWGYYESVEDIIADLLHLYKIGLIKIEK